MLGFIFHNNDPECFIIIIIIRDASFTSADPVLTLFQSQQEIEEERQKVNSSILALEEELDGYREQSEHWNERMTSVRQEWALLLRTH